MTRRDRPTAISGTWDFVGVLVALSGFIIVGGGLVLTLLQSNFRYWMRGNAEAIRSAWIQESTTWMMFVIFYLVAVIGCSTLILLARRRTLVVYNVEPAAFEMALVEVFDHLGCAVDRRGRLWTGTTPFCEVDTFSAGRTVTLSWLSEDKRLFEEVIRQLRGALATQVTAENPVHHWITAGAIGSGMVGLSSCGLLLYGLSLMTR
jgi:hypothetical protein